MHALTLKGAGLLNVLKTNILVMEPFIGVPQPNTKMSAHVGIWDTGATNSVITQKVIDALGLKPTGKALVSHAGGQNLSDTFLVNILLPSNITITSVKVTEGKLPHDADVLIGMDIIGLGDFTVTNHDGKTIMTFRIPSCGPVDYVEEANSRGK